MEASIKKIKMTETETTMVMIRKEATGIEVKTTIGSLKKKLSREEILDRGHL